MKLYCKACNNVQDFTQGHKDNKPILVCENCDANYSMQEATSIANDLESKALIMARVLKRLRKTGRYFRAMAALDLSDDE